MVYRLETAGVHRSPGCLVYELVALLLRRYVLLYNVPADSLGPRLKAGQVLPRWEGHAYICLQAEVSFPRSRLDLAPLVGIFLTTAHRVHGLISVSLGVSRVVSYLRSLRSEVQP